MLFDEFLKASFFFFAGDFTASLAAWGSQEERETAFLNVKLHAACFRVCIGLLADRRVAAVNSSRVFSLGFVIAGRSFLLMGKRKEQPFSVRK